MGGPFKHLNTDIFRKQLEVNVLGVVSVTLNFLELLGAYKGSKNQGKIIMISSVSGHRAYPYMSPYSASKFALEGMSDSLRRELMMYGIDVVLIEPGPVQSEIWNKAPKKDDNPLNFEVKSDKGCVPHDLLSENSKVAGSITSLTYVLFFRQFLNSA